MFVITWPTAQAVATGVGQLSHRVGTVHARNYIDEVTSKGEQTFQDVVNAGGMNPTKKGGPRRLSDAMYNSIGKKITVTGGLATGESGFGAGGGDAPVWTKYQEGGTYGNRKFSKTPTTAIGSGVPPMMAVPMAIMEMQTQQLNSRTKTLAAIKAEWDAI